MQVIEEAVTSLLDGARVGRIERIEPWFVYRVHLEGEPPSVIVKRLREDPNGFRVDPVQVATEVHALRFVESLGLDIAPRVMAADVSAHVLVLEDLAPRVPLPDVLIDGDPALAQDGVLRFAETLGSLNAASAGRAETFAAPLAAAMSPEERELRRWPDTLRSVEDFGLPASPAACRDIETMFDELAEPGAFLALSNGDAGTNNFLVAPGLPGKLIDFEFARFRHALLDAVHIHVQSPQWITLPEPRPQEDAYRQALVRGIPEAEDDRAFNHGLVAACLSYALVRLHRLEKLAERSRGDLSRLQLVATLESAAGVADDRGHLRELGGWCADVADAIRRRWPDTDVDLAAVPAWLSRDDRSERILGTTQEVGRGA